MTPFLQLTPKDLPIVPWEEVLAKLSWKKGFKRVISSKKHVFTLRVGLLKNIVPNAV